MTLTRLLGVPAACDAIVRTTGVRCRRDASFEVLVDHHQVRLCGPHAVQATQRRVVLWDPAYPPLGRAGARWTAEEDGYLTGHPGAPVGVIADHLGRSGLAVRQRREKLTRPAGPTG